MGESIELWEDTARWLSVGDPTGKDNRIALGAAWEGMALALSGQGMRFVGTSDSESSEYPPRTGGSRLVRSARVELGARPDPLLKVVPDRRSHRDVFRVATSPERAVLMRLIEQSNEAVLVERQSSIADIARLYDDAAASFMRDPAFVRELLFWMRLSHRDPNMDRDGLSSSCLALGAAETIAARLIMRPAVIRLLVFLRFERLLVSEAVKTRSAAGIVLFHASSESPLLEIGCSFYRFWLELVKAGFAAVPMSALVDSPTHAAQLLDTHAIPSGRRLIAVLRVGPAQSATPESARLPPAELVIP